MTDVINGVPRELKPCPFCNGQVSFHQDDECSGCHLIHCAKCDAFFDFATGADPENEAAELCELCALCACAWNHRTLLATAQPAADEDDEYMPAGIVESIEHSTEIDCVGMARDALAACVSKPTADGEREAFEAWAASVGYHTERDMFQREKYQSSLTWELWRVWQARAAQPQQAVAVTDEVRRLREALERVKLTEKEARHHSFSCAVYWNNAVTACICALSAHKTGKEE